MTIHTWKVLHNLASKASLYFNKWWSIQNYNSKPFNPALTSLEEGASSRIYTNYRPSSPKGGVILHGIKWNQLMESSSMQNWSWTEPTCQSGAWSGWHIKPYTATSAHRASRRVHTCGGEREGAIPHEDSWRSTLDLIWSPSSVKDLLDPVNLLQIWLISIKSAENPLIYDFGFAPLFINLLIKIINNWFLGLSDLSDGISLKT